MAETAGRGARGLLPAASVSPSASRVSNAGAPITCRSRSVRLARAHGLARRGGSGAPCSSAAPGALAVRVHCFLVEAPDGWEPRSTRSRPPCLVRARKRATPPAPAGDGRRASPAARDAV